MRLFQHASPENDPMELWNHQTSAACSNAAIGTKRGKSTRERFENKQIFKIKALGPERDVTSRLSSARSTA
jgi:hypothetical protein